MAISKKIPLKIGRLWERNSQKKSFGQVTAPFLGNSKGAKFHDTKIKH
jgi:hypothetical protein